VCSCGRLFGWGAFPCGPGECCGEGDVRFPPFFAGLLPFCGGRELFPAAIGLLLLLGMDAVLLMALGGRSFRLALLLTFELPLFSGCLLEVIFADGGRLTLPDDLAAITPFPLNTPALALAATAGCPWFTEANCERFVLAVCSWCVCSAVGCTWFSLAAACSAALGFVVVPPLPPL